MTRILLYQVFSIETTEVLFLNLVKSSFPFLKFSWASSLACLLILLFLLYLLSCGVKLPNLGEIEQKGPTFSADTQLCKIVRWVGRFLLSNGSLDKSSSFLTLPVLRDTQKCSSAFSCSQCSSLVGAPRSLAKTEKLGSVHLLKISRSLFCGQVTVCNGRVSHMENYFRKDGQLPFTN